MPAVPDWWNRWGAKAIATTSAGVAWSLGYPDGNRLPFEKLTHVVRDIVDAVRCCGGISPNSRADSSPKGIPESSRETA